MSWGRPARSGLTRSTSRSSSGRTFELGRLDQEQPLQLGQLLVILLGLALPDDGAHAPNERFHLPTLWQGSDTLVWFLAEAAQLERLAALPISRSAGWRAARRE
jgi:hypothetical protein